jgi:hypothetical protein
MLACTHPSFYGPMILFQNIVEVLHRSIPAILPQSTLGFEVHDGWRVTGVLVGIDYARRRMICSAQRFGEKALSRCCVAFSREKEVEEPEQQRMDLRKGIIASPEELLRCGARTLS